MFVSGNTDVYATPPTFDLSKLLIEEMLKITKDAQPFGLPELNKPLLNQINWIWVKNLMDKKPELNPTSAELLDWVTSGQIDAMRK